MTRLEHTQNVLIELQEQRIKALEDECDKLKRRIGKYLLLEDIRRDIRAARLFSDGSIQ